MLCSWILINIFYNIKMKNASVVDIYIILAAAGRYIIPWSSQTHTCIIAGTMLAGCGMSQYCFYDHAKYILRVKGCLTKENKGDGGEGYV